MPEGLLQWLTLVDFLVGVFFFATGFVVALQYFEYRHLSGLRLVNHLWLLSAFALLQAPDKWVGVWLFVQPRGPWTPALQFLLVMLSVASYSALYCFGCELVSSTRWQHSLLRCSSFFLIALWCMIFLATRPLVDTATWLEVGLSWSRFLLAFPGSVLAALALTTQARELEQLRLPSLQQCVSGAVLSFSLYSLSVGLVIPYTPPEWFFPMPPVGLKENSFLVLALRAACALGMGYFILRIVRIFNWENEKELERARERAAVLQERMRIGRDLHDGVIQSLYGVGLSLETALRAMPHSPQRAADLLAQAMSCLDKGITDIRYYIMDLNPPEMERETFHAYMTRLGREIEGRNNLQVEFEWMLDGEEEIPLEARTALYHILREALQNVAQHARASRVHIRMVRREKDLLMLVQDDGQGIRQELPLAAGRGMGMRNMEERVRPLGGELQTRSEAGKGTAITVVLPLPERKGGAGNAPHQDFAG